MTATGATGWKNVVSAGVLRGFTATCVSALTILVDAEADSGLAPAGYALRLLAGIGRPSSGQVVALGADPAENPALRREIALLGDPVLLGEDPPIAETARAIATVRGVSVDSITPLLAEADKSFEGRRALTDALANDARARLVLLAYPERYVEPAGRDLVLARARAALDRGATVVLATRALDEVLALAPDERATAVIVARGVATVAAPAHALPWAVPTDGLRARVVRVVLGAAPEGASASARLAADLLADAEVAATLSLVEPISAEEVRFHTRDPRAVSRAIGARARAGLDVRAMAVLGASAAEVLGGYR